ncbi:nickel ABC transporter permease [Halorhabdus sp. CUG00001]|uniref:nickel ABC transporter permease n=1 Tax=Halorhabdus sp. CUG00001 TaxID=2600297 RepID=UPI00131D0926|nr:nickel ABC transporter permease [Halorhabdus sp. CUG00001]
MVDNVDLSGALYGGLSRLWSVTVVAFGASLLTYGLIYLTPGDPAHTILAQQLRREPTAAEMAAFRAEQGLDESFVQQYLSWLVNVAHGDFGSSYYSSQSVRELLALHLPNTAELAIAAIVVAVVIAIPLGILSAVHYDTWIDHTAQVGALLGVSIPNFWLGYLLILVFSLGLGLTPVSGSGTVGHLVLPAITLGTAMAGIITRIVRTSVLDELGKDYVVVARSKGVSERLVVYKHALRNAFIPVVTIIGLQFGFVLNGAVVVEVVFQRPGLGTLLVDAVFARNYPVVQGVVLVTAVLFVLINQLVDLAYVAIDPQIERGVRS